MDDKLETTAEVPVVDSSGNNEIESTNNSEDKQQSNSSSRTDGSATGSSSVATGDQNTLEDVAGGHEKTESSTANNATQDQKTSQDASNSLESVTQSDDTENVPENQGASKTEPGDIDSENTDGHTTSSETCDKNNASLTGTESKQISEPGKEIGAEASKNRPSDNSESVYHVKWITFKRNKVPIITQNENGPCPLLAIMNVLILQNRIRLNPQSMMVSANQLMAHLGDCVLQNMPGEEGVSPQSLLNFEQNMGDAMAVMYKLQTGLDVNVKFTGVRDFEYTTECIIFDLLQIALYHGWLVDPQNQEEVEAVGKFSYNQLVEKIIAQKASDDPKMVQQALLAEQFLECSASQLTYHGLSELGTQLKEDELAVLFRNNHFITLYRHKGEMFQLVTDQGFLNETNVVWETLSNVEGDCHFVDCNFRTYTQPEPPPLQLQTDAPVNADQQVDQDYLVALSLQQEQQKQEPWNEHVSHLTDEELAQQLQAEEQRAAIAEQNEAQRQQQQQQGGRNIPSQPRRQQRPPSESKDSKCSIL